MSDSSPSPGGSPPVSRRPRWILWAAAVVVALAIWSWRRSTDHGSSVDASINLVTTDRDDLACASERTFGRYRCEFRAPGIPWPDPRRRPIAWRATTPSISSCT